MATRGSKIGHRLAAVVGAASLLVAAVGVTETATMGPARAAAPASGVKPALAPGWSHTCALGPNGNVQCWGRNVYGQLGDGTTTDSLSPVGVVGLNSVTAVSAGAGHTCALIATGTVKCWGLNMDGELGNGTTTNSSTPVAVSGITNATAIATGNQIGRAHV